MMLIARFERAGGQLLALLADLGDLLANTYWDDHGCFLLLEATSIHTLLLLIGDDRNALEISSDGQERTYSKSTTVARLSC
eukprot:scaffold167_cov110-Cylindrotheca_fusiformis.AAC.6